VADPASGLTPGGGCCRATANSAGRSSRSSTQLSLGFRVQLYSTEWEHLESTKAPRRVWPLRALRAWLRGYHELGTAERVVPLAFAGIYIAELIRQATS
jgi:hypothetical protein